MTKHANGVLFASFLVGDSQPRRAVSIAPSHAEFGARGTLGWVRAKENDGRDG